MHAFDAGPLAAQCAADVHQAGIIDCRTDFGLGIQNATHFIRQHGGRDVRVFNGKGAAKAAALFAIREVDQSQSAHVSQEPGGLIAHLKRPQRMAGGM